MSRITIKEYFATAGSRFTDKDARVIGPVLVELADQKEVTASSVVEAAQSANCPLHSYFEWNDKVAASKFREGQATEMINAVRVRFVSEEGHERATRAYRVAQVQSGDRNGRPLIYQTASAWVDHLNPLRLGVGDPDEIMGTALRELQQWRIKYRPYAEMLGEFKDAAVVILNQIGEFVEEFAATTSVPKPLEAIEDLKLRTQRHGVTTGAAAQFAEQFKYMLQAIDDAEKMFDVDAKLEGPLARENRLLRERLAELERGEAPLLARKIREATGLTEGESAALAVLMQREAPASSTVMLKAMYPWKTADELPDKKVIAVFVYKITTRLNIEITSQHAVGYTLTPVSKERLTQLIEAHEREKVA